MALLLRGLVRSLSLVLGPLRMTLLRLWGHSAQALAFLEERGAQSDWAFA